MRDERCRLLALDQAVMRTGRRKGRLALRTPMVTSAVVQKPGETFVTRWEGGRFSGVVEGGFMMRKGKEVDLQVMSVISMSLREARRKAEMMTTLLVVRRWNGFRILRLGHQEV